MWCGLTPGCVCKVLLRVFGRCFTNETLILTFSIQILKISNQTAKEQCKHHLACGEAHLFQNSGHLNNARPSEGFMVDASFWVLALYFQNKLIYRIWISYHPRTGRCRNNRWTRVVGVFVARFTSMVIFTLFSFGRVTCGSASPLFITWRSCLYTCW